MSIKPIFGSGDDFTVSQLTEPSSSVPPVLGVVYQNQKLIVLAFLPFRQKSRDNYLSFSLQCRNAFLVRLAAAKH